MNEHCVALLGRADQPIDAVEEYCRYLGEALRAHNFELELARVGWAESGWAASISELRRKARQWRGRWVLVQYTALAWSKRGFPFSLLRVIRMLRRAGSRVAVVYHDARPHTGTRWIDKLRRSAQRSTMRRAFVASEVAVLTVPAEKLTWLPGDGHRGVFIPVGANLPLGAGSISNRERKTGRTIAVFGITGGAAGEHETKAIVEAVRFAAKTVDKIRLLAFGRGADVRDDALREGLRELPVQVEVCGVISAAEIACRLCSCDVLLFVRGAISSRRGSAIAGIACGLPVVAFAGAETGAPITEAGVVVAKEGNTQELGQALARVLRDESYRDALVAKSRAAYEAHFCWPAIAERYAEALRGNR